jgi:methionyl-tRNA synthetase
METAPTPTDATPDAPKQSSPVAPVSEATTGTITDAPQQSVPAAPSEASTGKPTIEYEDFAKIDLRVAKVIEAEPVPKADKLLKLIVDLGGERRQILAGIAQQFTPESLIGKSVIVVANLAPRKLRGLESQGMLLAASAAADGPPLALVTVESDVPPGGIIR